MTIQQKFQIYHEQNPNVYEAFKKYAFAAINGGRKKYSAKSILERVRWHLNFEIVGDETYKNNNNYTSRYARLFIQDYPEHKDFFEFREIKTL